MTFDLPCHHTPQEQPFQHQGPSRVHVLGLESGPQPDLFSSQFFRHRALGRSGGTRRGLGLGLCWAVALAGEQRGSPSGNRLPGAPVHGPCLGESGGRARSVRAWGKGVFTWELASWPSQVCPVLGGFSFWTSVL